MAVLSFRMVENESSGVVIKKGKGKAEYCKEEEDEAETGRKSSGSRPML